MYKLVYILGGLYSTCSQSLWKHSPSNHHSNIPMYILCSFCMCVCVCVCVLICRPDLQRGTHMSVYVCACGFLICTYAGLICREMFVVTYTCVCVYVCVHVYVHICRPDLQRGIYRSDAHKRGRGRHREVIYVIDWIYVYMQMIKCVYICDMFSVFIFICIENIYIHVYTEKDVEGDGVRCYM